MMFCGIFVFSGVANALDIVLEPAYAQRDVGGKVRMHIYADNAVDLVSMGVKVSFDPTLVQVESASKNTDVWRFEDLEPDPLAYAPEVDIDNTEGTVTMIGGRLKPGISGSNILLGYVTFDCIAGDGINHATSVPINVQLAKPYNPSPPPSSYDNFVRENGDVEDPNMNIGNDPTQLATICIVDTSINPVGACEGDFDADGRVSRSDTKVLNEAYGTAFGDNDYNPAADLNADGRVSRSDKSILNNDYGRGDCPCFYAE